MNIEVTSGSPKFELKTYVPTTAIRKELYMMMYDIAKKHRDVAKQVDGKNETEEIQHSMICILFCYTCLEAFINTIGKDKLGERWENTKNPSHEGKWRAVSNYLATKKYGRKSSIYKETQEPFKSFRKLKMIREEYLVHRKAEFNDFAKTKYGNTEGTINILNSANADWACKTVYQMVDKLVKNMDEAPDVKWIE